MNRLIGLLLFAYKEQKNLIQSEKCVFGETGHFCAILPNNKTYKKSEQKSKQKRAEI